MCSCEDSVPKNPAARVVVLSRTRIASSFADPFLTYLGRDGPLDGGDRHPPPPVRGVVVHLGLRQGRHDGVAPPPSSASTSPAFHRTRRPGLAPSSSPAVQTAPEGHRDDVALAARESLLARPTLSFVLLLHGRVDADRGESGKRI